MAPARAFKTRLYAQYARISRALANPVRLELLDLLAQSPRTVDSLATELDQSIANVSQHLQVLRASGLVESRRRGVFVEYRPSDDGVSDLYRALRETAERRLADLERLVRTEFASRRSAPDAIGMDELLLRATRDDVVILDARPAHEFAAGHIAGAISVPVADLRRRLRRLPKRQEFVAYCRGPYCVYADQAVDLLMKSGRRARRLSVGFPEWKSAGHPVEADAAAS